MKNVILFIVDSVRYYSTGGKDDRDKLSMMDRFAEESIYFPLTVTSAPSSVMSLSTMLTSLPSYYIARNYDDFRYDNDQFISLHNILRDNGYDTRSLFNARELRFLFGDVIKHVDKKYWPKGTNNNQVNWSNSVMNEILEKFLDSETFKRPLFFIAWYNIRLDPNTSLLIEEGINILKRNNVWDNSIFLLASDHGYMDPNRGYTPEKLEKMGLSHDLLLTDDNIRIPFYLRYPGSPVKKIEQPVSTLDFLPTILSLLDIKAPQTKTYQMKGKDLTSLINGNSNSIEDFTSRKVRCDARFFAQADRATAIRGANYKYIARPDRNVEEFYDLDKDSWESNNIINDINYQNIVEEYRSEYIKSEKEIIDFQFKYLLSKLDKSLKDKDGLSNIAVLGFGEPYYLDNISKVMREYWGDNTSIELIINESIADKMNNVNLFSDLHYYNADNFQINYNNVNNKKMYDQLIILTDTRNKNKYEKQKEILLSQISYSKVTFLNPNMEFETREKTLRDPRLIFRVLKNKRNYYLKNPGMILHHFVKWFKIVTK